MKTEKDLDQEINWKINKFFIFFFILIYFGLISFLPLSIMMSKINDVPFINAFIIIICNYIFGFVLFFYFINTISPLYYFFNSKGIYYRYFKKIRKILFVDISKIDIPTNNSIIIILKTNKGIVFLIDKDGINEIKNFIPQNLLEK
jgi:hypothetical protein